MRGDRREGVEASHLQLLHLAGPAAALLTVDAADGQSQDLLLQLWVWVDLREDKQDEVSVAGGRSDQAIKSKCFRFCIFNL